MSSSSKASFRGLPSELRDNVFGSSMPTRIYAKWRNTPASQQGMQCGAQKPPTHRQPSDPRRVHFHHPHACPWRGLPQRQSRDLAPLPCPIIQPPSSPVGEGGEIRMRERSTLCSYACTLCESLPDKTRYRDLYDLIDRDLYDLMEALGSSHERLPQKGQMKWYQPTTDLGETSESGNGSDEGCREREGLRHRTVCGWTVAQAREEEKGVPEVKRRYEERLLLEGALAVRSMRKADRRRRRA